MKTLTGYLRQVSYCNEFWMELTNGEFVEVTMGEQDVPTNTLIALSVEDDGRVSEFPCYEKVTK